MGLVPPNNLRRFGFWLATRVSAAHPSTERPNPYLFRRLAPLILSGYVQTKAAEPLRTAAHDSTRIR